MERPPDSEIKRGLLERRAALVRRVGRIETDVRHQETPLDKDSEEQVVQVVNDPVLDVLGDRGRRELAEIDAALSRIDEGSYGACVGCGRKIEPARLRTLPAASHCAECAA